MRTEPVLKVNALVGLLTAASAAVGVLASGGEPLVAVGAALTSLTVSLGGAQAIRGQVEPVDRAESRRVQAVALAEGAEYLEPDDPDAPTTTASEAGPPPVPGHQD